MAKEDGEREPADGHYVACDECNAGRFFEGVRLSEAADSWAFVHSLSHSGAAMRQSLLTRHTLHVQ